MSHNSQDGERLNGREIFTRALRMMSSDDEGSERIQNFLSSFESAGPDFGAQKGISEDFLDSLERVDVKNLAEGADCPICTNKFVDNDYPLVVKLPCHVQGKTKKEHIFDLDCIAPWLKANSTCPLCRFNLNEVDKIRKERLEEELRKARNNDSEEEEDDEEDWELYGWSSLPTVATATEILN